MSEGGQYRTMLLLAAVGQFRWRFLMKFRDKGAS